MNVESVLVLVFLPAGLIVINKHVLVHLICLFCFVYLINNVLLIVQCKMNRMDSIQSVVL